MYIFEQCTGSNEWQQAVYHFITKLKENIQAMCITEHIAPDIYGVLLHTSKYFQCLSPGGRHSLIRVWRCVARGGNSEEIFCSNLRIVVLARLKFTFSLSFRIFRGIAYLMFFFRFMLQHSKDLIIIILSMRVKCLE